MLLRGWLLTIAWTLVIFAPDPAAPLIEDAIEIIQLIKEVGSGISVTWGFIADVEDIKMPKEKRLMSNLAQLSRKLDTVQHSIDSSHSEMVYKLLSRAPGTVRLELRLSQLSTSLANIKWAENTMRRYAEDHNTAEKLTLEQFARWAVAHEAGSISVLLDAIHDFVAPQKSELGILNTGLMELLLSAMMDSNNYLCELKQSPHQLLFNMYNTIALTELKGYTTMQFSWMLLKLYGHGNFTNESNHLKKQFLERSVVTLESVKSAMSRASREMWRCDPDRHVEDTTYVAVTRLLQGYIENEVDMNDENTCRENCAFYKVSKNEGCFKEMLCSRQKPCNGEILSCQYIDSDMTICPSSHASSRRYEWIEYENGRTLGKKGACNRGSTKVDSWWRWLVYHCSYCFCICDQTDSLSDRYISMLEATSDVGRNKVITGLRFVKKNRVIHLQISEGIMEPMGKINQKTIAWQPVRPIDIRKTNEAYHTLSHSERIIDLDDLQGPKDHVLTGVRFRKLGSHINFEIMTTPFDFKTGRLTDPYKLNEWKSNDNTDAQETDPRTRVELIEPDIPTNSKTPSIPDSKSDQYIEFTHTSLDSDVAQTTVPFLDAQNVMPAHAVPLSGAGIYHKGQKMFGGFIAPKVFTYDFSQHMEVDTPDLDKVINQ